jgi:NAD(P)-dependent dehydrogenase (short-subunit alcohol dehydrogenase family)
MGLLDGKVAIVWGASANNGGTAAHFMAREGAKIVAVDLVPEATKETVDFLHSRKYDALGITGDGTNADFVKSAVEQAAKHYGHIDISLNMVGRQYRWPVWEVNLHDWKRQLDGFLTGGMLVTKYVSQHMIEKGIKGSIIHICSDAAHQGEPGNSGYSAAKGGLLNFVRAAAMDLAYYGIRVNSISPTYIEHNMWRFGGVGGARTRLRVTTQDFLQGIPLARFCRASDVANAAIFLGSDMSSFITAHDIPLDGGARQKYWPWIPAAATGLTADEYYKNTKRTRFGEVVEE